MIAIASLAHIGCGESPADKAVGAARQLVSEFKAGEHRRVCTQLTPEGQGTLVSAALAKDRSSVNLSDCEGASRYLLDGTAAEGRKSLDVNGEPTDVDMTTDGARVTWDQCCSFALEEVGGDYGVSNAQDLALYFDIAGAGSGAGSGSPSATAPDETTARIRANLEAADESFPDQGFGKRVTNIDIAGPRATLTSDLSSTDSKVVGVCRGASGGQESNPVADLPGVSQLLITTAEGKTQDCADLLGPV